MEFKWTVTVNEEDDAVQIWGENLRTGDRRVMRQCKISELDGIAKLLLHDEFDAIEQRNKRLKGMFCDNSTHDQR